MTVAELKAKLNEFPDHWEVEYQVDAFSDWATPVRNIENGDNTVLLSS